VKKRGADHWLQPGVAVKRISLATVTLGWPFVFPGSLSPSQHPYKLLFRQVQSAYNCALNINGVRVVNPLIIRALEMSVIGGNPATAEYAVMAFDLEHTYIDSGYHSKEELFKAWPDLITCASKVFATPQFSGKGHAMMRGGPGGHPTIVLNFCSSISLEGFPESATASPVVLIT
jgi:hypothetical protein